MSAFVGEGVLVSLAMVHLIELVVLEEVELVVLVGLVELSAYTAGLEHESIDWSVLTAREHASFSQVVDAPVEFLP